MYTLIAFATQWGSKFGGINSFNTDFLCAFGVAFHRGAKVVCIVATAEEEEILDAANSHVTLVALPYPPSDKRFSAAQAQTGVEELKRLGISFDPAKTVWLGHDLISGAAANEAVRFAGGRSAIIHHMSYDHYESIAENSTSAHGKMQQQTELFQQADLVLAVGPLLRDAIHDRRIAAKEIHMLIPGMAEIDLLPAPKTFTAFVSGRLSDNAAKIKQGHLGIAAFAQANRNARKSGMPDGLCRQPKLVLRGVDFEGQGDASPSGQEDPETELKHFAEGYADGVINLHALPYTHDRQALYNDLRGASVAMMPSWHEGFGLVAWEAIAAGVPLVVGKNSGVYLFLEETFPGAGPGCVAAIDIKGAVDAPFFHADDLRAVVSALTAIAHKPDVARRKAGILRNMLGEYTWPACAEQAAEAFHWDLHKGSMPAEIRTQVGSEQQPAPLPAKETTTSHSPLQLPVKQWRAGSGMADSQLLRAEEAQVPFDPARQPDLQAVLTWRNDPQWPQAVRLITGAGGVGKTRLALELCQQSVAQGWQAGFLDHDCSAETMADAWQALRNQGQPLLMVIDYAETRQPILLALVRAMLKSPGEQPVRVLLLARNGGEWWDNLPGLDPQCEALLMGYATSGPFCLPPLYLAVPERRQAYGLAVQAFAQSLNVSPPDAIPELSGEHFGRPLFLQMAALLALHGERPTTAEGLTRALLNHERRYWRGLLAKTAQAAHPEHHAQQLLALATLAGGFTTPALARPYWKQAHATAQDAVDLSTLFHLLTPLYPGKQGLEAVRPDLLGEALVAQSLLQPEADGLLDAVLNDNAAQPVRRHALTVLSRLAHQRPDLHEIVVLALVRHFGHCYLDIFVVATETVGALPLLAETAFTRLALAPKSQLAGLLSPQLKEESVQLAGLACAVSGFLTEKAKMKYLKKKNTDCMADYADKLGNHSVDLHRLGRNDEALTAAKNAFTLIQKLYKKNWLLFAPDYARSLNNLANRLSEIGLYNLALEHSQQALILYQQLAQNEPNRFESAHAMLLNNFANHLSQVGQYDRALCHARQALEMYKRLAANTPDHFTTDYAMSLHNLAGHLSDAGQYDEALCHAQQALEIQKRLAETNNDRFEPAYALSLNNLASYLSKVGQYDQAFHHIRQSLEICKRLAVNNSERFGPDYAMSLNNLASHLSETGLYDQALYHARQVLVMYQRLAATTPNRFELEHALSMNNLSGYLSKTGRYNDALYHARQALEMYQRLATKCPARFEVGSFSCLCHTYFLQWMVNPVDTEGRPEEFPAIPTTAPPHHRLRLRIYRNFVQACYASEQIARADKFKQVFTAWRELSLADRNQTQEYWLCAAAWNATFAPPDTLAGSDWQTEWRHFQDQRQGAIPAWMLDIAHRLAFQWDRTEASG